MFSFDNSVEREAVRKLGEAIGYGNMMDLARDCWRESLKNFPGHDLSGGEFQVGPCVALTEPCGCTEPHKCDWCCGSRWLTRHVKALKDAAHD